MVGDLSLHEGASMEVLGEKEFQPFEGSEEEESFLSGEICHLFAFIPPSTNFNLLI